MSEEFLHNEEAPQEEPAYTPRPAWQVWVARLGLLAFLLFLMMYYFHIFGGGA